MNTVRRRGATALTAAIALALGGIPAAYTTSSILAAGEGTTTLAPATDYFPGPTLTLSTTSSLATVTVSGTDLVQDFDGGQFCEITPKDGAANLLDIKGTIRTGTAASAALAGFRDGSIGVFEGTNASQCFRVDAASFTTFETLTLGVGSDLDGLLASSGTFDLEMKTNDTRIKVEAVDANGHPVAFITPTASRDYFEIFTGKQRRTPEATGPFVLLSGARSGDHIPFTLPALEGEFLKVRLTAIVGSFTLEGGTDPGATKTTLSLVQPADATFCSDPDEANGETNFIEELNTKVEYLGNAVSEPSCFGVQLTPGDEEVRFIYPRGSAPADAQFRYTIEWTLLNEGRTPEVTLPAAEIDFELPRPDMEGGFTTLPFCPDELYGEDRTEGPSLSETTLSYADFVEDDVNYRDFDTDDETDSAKQYACIDTRNKTEVTASEITITDTIFVVGDARMRL